MPQATVIEIVEPTGTNTTSTHSEGKPVGTYVPPRTNPLETPILDTTQFEQQDDEQLLTPIRVTDTANAQP